MRVLAIIPSRYNSNRFPGKPLADIMGKSMIQRVFEQCQKCSQLNRIIVATDDERISFHVKSFGGEVMMTSKDHITGSDRCSEVLNAIDDRFDIVVNIQGDEPYINPEEISKVLTLFEDEDCEIGTLAKKISDYAVYISPDNPKVFFDKNNIAVSFERNGTLNEEEFKKTDFFQHIGIYAFKSEILSKIIKLDRSKNEIKNSLEQLRWMDNKYKIKIGVTDKESLSIDREEDIEKIKRLDLKNS